VLLLTSTEGRRIVARIPPGASAQWHFLCGFFTMTALLERDLRMT
jgi:hypothetical protein